jgi:hypothetical protein
MGRLVLVGLEIKNINAKHRRFVAARVQEDHWRERFLWRVPVSQCVNCAVSQKNEYSTALQTVPRGCWWIEISLLVGIGGGYRYAEVQR